MQRSGQYGLSKRSNIFFTAYVKTIAAQHIRQCIFIGAHVLKLVCEIPMPFDIEILLRAPADRTDCGCSSWVTEKYACVSCEILKTASRRFHGIWLTCAGRELFPQDGWQMDALPDLEPADATQSGSLTMFAAGSADGAMARERERLEGICCGTPYPVKLLQAPQPIPYTSSLKAFIEASVTTCRQPGVALTSGASSERRASSEEVHPSGWNMLHSF